MISFSHKGDFSKLTGFLERAKGIVHLSVLDRYGRRGVAALASATPVESGTAAITFKNSHIVDGVPIAIILQYGHGTGTGGWVEGRDYINPAIQPIFDEIVEEAWREVTQL